MNTIKDISEPRRAYDAAKEAYHQNVVDYFNQLIKESHTDEEKNKVTCQNYYNKLNEVSDTEKLKKKKISKRKFLTFLEVLCYCLVVLIPVGILVIRKKAKAKVIDEINHIEDEIKKRTNEAETIKGDAEKELLLLNSLYDWNIPAKLVSETIPLIQMDHNFDNKRYYQLHDRYGYDEHKGKDVSTLYVQSGSVYGNPFVIEMNRTQEMVQHVYVGSRTVTYTVREYVNGHTVTSTRVETLHAEVVKPRPEYTNEVWLVYGNDAAPKLHFVRHPSNANNLSDKQIAKLAKKNDKALEKKLKKDATFTKMGNSEFEMLFGGTNRDNEVEFRLLFTPLAQKNMLDLIKTNEPFGDDFMFAKEGPLNYVRTIHSQSFNYKGSPADFIDFDIVKAREKFVARCDEYFTKFYFDIAPLMCIPLYQNYKAQEYIYKDNHIKNVTAFETESIANAYPSSYFMPKDSGTEAILKTELVKKEKDHDIVNIIAHAFRSIPHITEVPAVAGNGHTYMVPVTWYEFIPISKKTPFVVAHTEPSRNKYLNNKQNVFASNSYKDVYYQKGLISALMHLNNQIKKGE